MKTLKFRLIVLLCAFGSGIILVLFFSSCSHSTDALDSIKPVCFEKEVLPIFRSNCALSGCHNGEGERREAFTDYTSIMKSITPYSLNNSRAYQAVISTWGQLMPPSPQLPLTLEQRTIIAVWIEQGALNSTCN